MLIHEGHVSTTIVTTLSNFNWGLDCWRNQTSNKKIYRWTYQTLNFDTIIRRTIKATSRLQLIRTTCKYKYHEPKTKQICSLFDFMFVRFVRQTRNLLKLINRINHLIVHPNFNQFFFFLKLVMWPNVNQIEYVSLQF